MLGNASNRNGRLNISSVKMVKTSVQANSKVNVRQAKKLKRSLKIRLRESLL